MKCIKILKDEDFNLKGIKFDNPTIRIGARGIVVRKDGKMAIINKKIKNEFKLPGGELELGESPENAFIREVLEETGCLVKIVDKLGIIEEHKSLENFKQKSYLFVGSVTENTNRQHLTKKEKDEGTKLLWTTPNEGLELIKNSLNNLKESKYENLYHSKYIVLRDKYILEYYLNKN